MKLRANKFSECREVAMKKTGCSKLYWFSLQNIKRLTSFSYILDYKQKERLHNRYERQNESVTISR